MPFAQNCSKPGVNDLDILPSCITAKTARQKSSRTQLFSASQLQRREQQRHAAKRNQRTADGQKRKRLSKETIGVDG